MRVLVVDDDQDVAEAVGRTLRIQGADPDVALTYEEGLRLLTLNTYDAVVSDYEIQCDCGIDLLARALVSHPGAKMVLMSGSKVAEKRCALELPTVRFCLKPFSTESFLRYLGLN